MPKNKYLDRLEESLSSIQEWYEGTLRYGTLLALVAIAEELHRMNEKREVLDDGK